MINLEKTLSAKPKYIIGLVQAVGVATYITLLITFFTGFAPRFEHDSMFLAPIIFLMVFVTSALICGSLMLAYPLWLTVQGRIKDAAEVVVWGIVWLLAILLSIIILAINQ